MNDIFGIIKNGEIVQWTMKPQTSGEFVVCDINDLPKKKFKDGKLVNKTSAELNAEKLANYAALRISEYGDIADQLDEIYRDINAWKARIAAVKAKYPKPL